MKTTVSVLLALVLFCGIAQAQTSPTWPSPFITDSTGRAYNILPGDFSFRTKTGSAMDSLFMGKVGSTSYLRPYLSAQSWYLGAPAQHWDMIYNDTLVTSYIWLGLNQVTSFTGSRLILNSGGVLGVSFNTLPMTGAEMANQTVTPIQIDSSQTYILKHIFLGTSLYSDSAVMSKRYIDSTLGGKGIAGFPGTTWGDNTYVKFDSTSGTFILSAGTGAGDVVSIDTNGATAGGVTHITDPTLQFIGSTVSTAAGVITVTTAGVNTISSLGDSLVTRRWVLDTALKTTQLEVQRIQGRASVPLSIYQTSGAMWLDGSAGNGNIYINGIGPAVGGSTTPAAGFLFSGNTLTGILPASAALTSINLFSGRTMALGQFTKRPFLGDSTKSDSGLTTVKNVRDTVSAYLATNLANYVLKTTENWQISGAGPYIWTLKNGYSGDVPLTITRTAGSPYSTKIEATSGDLILSAPITGTKVKINGPSSANPVFSISSNVQLNGLALSGASSLGLTNSGFSVSLLPSASTSASYNLTLPASLGSGGYMNVSSTGVITLSTPSGSGGSATVYANSQTAGNLADTAILKSGSSALTFTMTQRSGTPGADDITLTLANLDQSYFANDTGITSEGELKDSLANFLASRSAIGTTINGVTYTPAKADTFSVWSKYTNTQMLAIFGQHTGGTDSILFLPQNGFGMRLGGAGIARFVADSSLFSNKVVFGKNSSTASFNWMDSLLMSNIRGYQRVGLTAGNIVWDYGYGKKWKKWATWPYIDTSGIATWAAAGLADSIAKRKYLISIADSSTSSVASTDTSLHWVAEWEAPFDGYLDSAYLYGACGTSVSDTMGIDSFYVYKNGTKQQGVDVDFRVTTLTYLKPSFTAVTFSKGDLIDVVFRNKYRFMLSALKVKTLELVYRRR